MKKRKVRFHRDFSHDLNAQVAWMKRQHRPEWVAGLRQAVVEAIVLLSAIPRAGVPSTAAPLFKLVLRKVPFVIWYSIAAEGGDVVVLRLFHTKQDRPRGRSRRG